MEIATEVKKLSDLELEELTQTQTEIEREMFQRADGSNLCNACANVRPFNNSITRHHSSSWRHLSAYIGCRICQFLEETTKFESHADGYPEFRGDPKTTTLSYRIPHGGGGRHYVFELFSKDGRQYRFPSSCITLQLLTTSNIEVFQPI